MNLLLFLSALLSALTGVVGGARVAEVPQYETAAAVVAQVAAAPVTVARRPVAALPSLTAVTRLTAPVRSIASIFSILLHQGRRRE